MDKAGLKKAATLLAVLSGREKERLLAEFDPATTEVLRGALSRLGSIPTPVVRAVLAEFLAALKKPDSNVSPCLADAQAVETADMAPNLSRPNGSPGEPSETIAGQRATESDSDLLFRLFGSNGSPKDYRIETKRQQPQGPHFPLSSAADLLLSELNESNEETGDPMESFIPRGDFFRTLARLRPNEIFARLQHERPQTAAVVLAQFSDTLARRVLAEFPPSAAEEIRGRIERLAPPDDEVLAAMERALTTETR